MGVSARCAPGIFEGALFWAFNLPVLLRKLGQLSNPRFVAWPSGLSLAAEQSSQESWIRGLYKLDFVEEGHVQSGHVGLPLPLNKALKWGQEAWILGLSQLYFMEEGHVQSGQVEGSFVVLMWPLLLRRAPRQVTGILG